MQINSSICISGLNKQTAALPGSRQISLLVCLPTKRQTPPSGLDTVGQNIQICCVCTDMNMLTRCSSDRADRGVEVLWRDSSGKDKAGCWTEVLCGWRPLTHPELNFCNPPAHSCISALLVYSLLQLYVWKEHNWFLLCLIGFDLALKHFLSLKIDL